MTEKRDLRSMTIGEAEAYWMGYRDGMNKRKEMMGQKVGPHPECQTYNPSLMCLDCKCWKMTREYCS